MAITVLNIVPAKTIPNTQAAQYTSEDKTVVDKFTATNTSASAVTLSVNIVAASGSVGDENLIIDVRSIAPNETYMCPEMIGQVLEAGWFISTLASVTSVITICVSGRKIS